MIIFLYRPDDFRARLKITELREKFVKEVDPTGSSVVTLDGSKATLNELSSAYRPRSLFAKRRFIVIDDVLANKNKDFVGEVAEFVTAEKNNDNILVVYESRFVEKKTGAKVSIMKPGPDDKLVALNKAEKNLFDCLKKSHFVQPFQSLSQVELLKTLAKLAATAGASLSDPAARTLMRLVGVDLWPLSHEVAKLSAYACATAKEGEKAVITETHVKEMVSQSVTENIFALTDALGNKQTALAVQLLSGQIEGGVHPSYLLTMMLWQFKILASVRQALDEGLPSREIGASLSLHPYVLEKSINQVRKFNLVSLQRIINRLIELDYKNKTGQGTLEELLPVTVASF